jgi:ATP-dependent Lhr-like helicase
MKEDLFHPAVQSWLVNTYNQPTPAQEKAWPVIKEGKHTLIAAPTGSGKTLAAFLCAIDDLVREAVGEKGSDPQDGFDPFSQNPGLKDEVYVLYVSPLKALSNDIHKNLEEPLSGITELLEGQGNEQLNLLDSRLRGHPVEKTPSAGRPLEIRSAVRTGDTTQIERTRMRTKPPHILVTTPESLFILLTSDSGRQMLKTVRSVIVDEIHALAGNKRGSHLSLSLERLEALCDQHPVRIGLSATQKPIDTISHYLIGTRDEPCEIVDSGYTRERDLAIVVPDQPLGPLMADEAWQDIYNRLAAIAEENRTTLIFVNTRRLAERAARHLADRLGEENVTAHHGSLAKEHRMNAEQRLKNGELKVLVATASLELGIDIGDVSCVCQLGTPRSISAFLQRVGRSGHQVGSIPKGRLFPLTRDDLVECTALLDAVHRGELDRIHIPPGHLDVLSQQIIAEVGMREWQEDELYDHITRAWPYRELARNKYNECLQMLADGFTTRRGRRSRYIFRDAVNKQLKPRPGAKLTAVTNAGAIPDQFDYNVILEPQGIFIGTLNEDFAFESLPGDIFQLGNTSYRILQVAQGKVRVEDAHGQPPNMPFWFGEAPGRSDELSESVSRLRKNIDDKLKDGIEATVTWLLNEFNSGSSHSGESQNPDAVTDTSVAKDLQDNEKTPSLPPPIRRSREGGNPVNLSRPEGSTLDPHVAQQLIDYLAATKAALGKIPTQDDIFFERFFDEAGDQHLVIHSPYGSRLNRAWGLALRKRFCRQFNFELQAAALEDSIVISLGATHSFPLEEVSRYLNSNSIREILIQALLAAPVFMTRWRWNATIALALKRNHNGKRVPAQFQRMDAEDLIAVVFPDQLACQENITGDREVPDHPLVQQTVEDCLTEVMDIEGITRLLTLIEQEKVSIHYRDLNGPSPLAQEILFARPYAFLDDAPAEERRTQAVNARRFMDPADAAELAGLSPEAIKQVATEAWPVVTTPDELHDALMVLGFLTEEEMGSGKMGTDPLSGSVPIFPLNELIKQKRATVLQTSTKKIYVCAERLPQIKAVFPDATMEPEINPAGPSADKNWTYEEALVELLRARLEGSAIISESKLRDQFECSEIAIRTALMVLENEGYAMRGNFTGGNETEWCERGLLARIHRYTIKSLRSEIKPVTAADYMRFLFAWHGMTERPEGEEAIVAALDRLEGFAIPAAAWESDILPTRIKGYMKGALDHLCTTGRIVWARFNPAKPKQKAETSRSNKAGILRNTPITLLDRHNVDYWRPQHKQNESDIKYSANATTVLNVLKEQGASFFIDIVKTSGLLRTHVEEALAELAAMGLVTSDSYAGLRALITPANKKPGFAPRHRRRRSIASGRSIDDAGRWSIIPTPVEQEREEKSYSWIRTDWDTLNHIAYTLLKRYGVVFHKVLEREQNLPPWRELLYAWRRMEARGEIRGGRFVEGFSGEQFALPDAVASLRKHRNGDQESPPIVISATDPLNLVGIVLPGDKISALHTNRLLFKNGLPAAKQLNGEIHYFGFISPHAQWEINHLLTRKRNPAGYVEVTKSYSN